MNKLDHIDEFRRILADYQIADSAKQVMKQTRLVFLVGPSSSGRNTIINELKKTGQYHQIVSDTTRLPRANNGILEQNGREYWFRSEREILADLKAGQFLEAAIIHNQQVSGISIRELKAAVNEQKIAINEIEVVGADNLHKADPDAMFFFVLPPSVDEWMVRMQARGELPADETRRRLESAVMEIEMALTRDYYIFVVNNTYMQLAKRMHAIITEGQAVDQEQGRKLAEQLLIDIKQHLA